MSNLEEKINELLEKGADWQRFSTTIPGVFMIKAPGRRNFPASIMVEIIPVDSAGKPTKRKGLFLRSLQDLKSYREIITHEKIDSVLEAISKRLPAEAPKAPEEVIEI